MEPKAVEGVFLSYRREETSHVAGRLADRLGDRFGADRVFMDVDSLEPGADFAEAIRSAVADCDVLLALVGRSWATVVDDDGRRRLDDPDDFVALEVGAALASARTKVIPVLVDGATMPTADTLPPRLAALSQRHAVRVDHETFTSDVNGLLDRVGGGRSRAGRWVADRRRVLVGVLAVALALTVALGVLRPWQAGSGWVAAPDLPEPVEAAAVAAHDGRLWVAGGVSAGEGRRKLDAVRVYDLGAGSWRDASPLPVALSHAALVSTGAALFVLGGLSDTGSVDTVYRLDSPTGRWQADVPLPEPRGAGAAAWDGGRIVFAGGVGPDHRAAADVWALDQQQWRRIGSLSQPREKLAAATDGFGTVWFLAGRDPNADAGAVSAVDVVQAESVKDAGSVSPVQGPAAVWWPDAGVCMLGGQGPQEFSARVECLQDSSSVSPPDLTSARAGLGAAVVGRSVFVVGGYDGARHGSATVELWQASS